MTKKDLTRRLLELENKVDGLKEALRERTIIELHYENDADAYPGDVEYHDVASLLKVLLRHLNLEIVMPAFVSYDPKVIERSW